MSSLNVIAGVICRPVMWLSYCLNPRSRKLELENLTFIYIFLLINERCKFKYTLRSECNFGMIAFIIKGMVSWCNEYFKSRGINYGVKLLCAQIFIILFSFKGLTTRRQFLNSIFWKKNWLRKLEILLLIFT